VSAQDELTRDAAVESMYDAAAALALEDVKAGRELPRAPEELPAELAGAHWYYEECWETALIEKLSAPSTN